MTSDVLQSEETLVQATALADAVRRLAPLIRSNPIIPALSAVRLQCAGGYLWASGGTEQVRLALKVVGAAGAWVCCPEAAPLSRFLAGLPTGPVRLTTGGEESDHWLTIRYGRTGTATFPAFAGSDYPVIRAEQGEVTHLSPETAAALADAIDRVRPFVRPDPGFPAYYHAYLESHVGTASLAGTDGQRLVEEVFDWEGDSLQLTLPHYALPALADALRLPGATLRLHPSWITVQSEDQRLDVRRMDTEYRSFEALYAAEARPIILRRDDLMAALTRLLAVPRADKVSVYATMTADEDGGLRLAASEGDYSVEEVVPAEIVDADEPVTVLASGLYSLLQAARGETIELQVRPGNLTIRPQESRLRATLSRLYLPTAGA